MVYGLDRASFNQGINAQYDFSVEQDLAQTLISKGPGGVMTTETNIWGGRFQSGRSELCCTQANAA